MTTAIADPLPAIKEYLEANAEVAALATDGIHVALVDDVTPIEEGGTVLTIAPFGGLGQGPGARSYIPVWKMGLQLRAYAPTDYAARQLFLAAAGAMQRLGREGRYMSTTPGAEGVLVYHASVDTGPFPARETPDWPYCMGLATITFAAVPHQEA